MWVSDIAPQIKACRLCASITDDSVTLKEDMKTFLEHFLDIGNSDCDSSSEFFILPQKICVTCFQDCCDAKRFKERCKKVIEKLSKLETAVPKSFMLGISSANKVKTSSDTHDKDTLKSNESESPSNSDEKDGSRTEVKSKKTSASGTKENTQKILRVENCDAATVERYLKNKLVVEISWNERQMCDVGSKDCEVMINSIKTSELVDMKTKLTPNSKKFVNNLDILSQKISFDRIIRTSNNSSYSYEAPSRKKLPQQAYISLDDSIMSTEFSFSPSSRAKLSSFTSIEKKQQSTPFNEMSSNSATKYSFSDKSVNNSMSSPVLNLYGGHNKYSKRKLSTNELHDKTSKKIKSKNNSCFKHHDNRLTDSTTTRLNSSLLKKTSDVEKIAQKSSNSESETDANLAAKKFEKKTSCRKKQYREAIVNFKTEKSEPKSSIHDGQLIFSCNEDLQEAYPSQGPYQCELCQNITQTKEEFVSHIKTKHLEDVDDEVLSTLNSDLRKARRNMELASI